VTIQRCTNCIIVIGVCEKVLRVIDCQDITIISVCKIIHIGGCTSCKFHLCCTQPPFLLGSNKILQLGPYNTYYPKLEYHASQASIDLDCTKNWSTPTITPSTQQNNQQSYSIIDCRSFSPFVIPIIGGGPTKENPCILPSDYQSAIRQKKDVLFSLQSNLSELGMNTSLLNELHIKVDTKFQEWLEKTGNITQIRDLIKMESDNG